MVVLTPDLAKEGRTICEIEQQLLSKLAMVPLKLEHCQCDDDGHCCTFRPEASAELGMTSSEVEPTALALGSLSPKPFR